MTSPIVKQLMKESGKDKETVAEVWEKAKALTQEMYGVDSIEDFSGREYAHAEQTARKMLGMTEQITVADFLKSGKNAREFIEDVQTSGNIGVDIDRSVTLRKTPADLSTTDSETNGYEDDLEAKDDSIMDTPPIDAHSDPDNPVGEADPLSIYEKKNSVDMKTGQGQIMGLGRDANGNKVVKVKTNTGHSFSIQTNQNVPTAHKLSTLSDASDAELKKIENEILAYVNAYGTSKQKDLIA